MRDVIILGSTGSIGTQAVEVVRAHPDKFRVVGLSAGGGHIETLATQIGLVKPHRVAVPSEEAADALKKALASRDIKVPAIIAEPTASCDLARTGADVVLNAITGYAGLEPTLAVLLSGSTLALANKESLVVGGQLVTSMAKPGQIVPVDSEHSAIAQALRAGKKQEVSRLILTASGGPFRKRTHKSLLQATPEEAMAHPTWHMGRVVTINSATLVNKGLELIEAALLFSIPWDRIQVVVHPQSIVHSMVEFCDGSTIAQCAPPDMRLPIALALSWPERVEAVIPPCDWTQSSTWTFEPLNNKTFPAVELARRVGERGGTAPAVFNAANEVCVDAFCAGRIGFLGIVDTVEKVVTQYMAHMPLEQPALTLEQIRTADSWAREAAETAIGRTS